MEIKRDIINGNNSVFHFHKWVTISDRVNPIQLQKCEKCGKTRLKFNP